MSFSKAEPLLSVRKPTLPTLLSKQASELSGSSSSVNYRRSHSGSASVSYGPRKNHSVSNSATITRGIRQFKKTARAGPQSSTGSRNSGNSRHIAPISDLVLREQKLLKVQPLTVRFYIHPDETVNELQQLTLTNISRLPIFFITKSTNIEKVVPSPFQGYIAAFDSKQISITFKSRQPLVMRQGKRSLTIYVLYSA